MQEREKHCLYYMPLKIKYSYFLNELKIYIGIKVSHLLYILTCVCTYLHTIGRYVHTAYLSTAILHFFSYNFFLE